MGFGCNHVRHSTLSEKDDSGLHVLHAPLNTTPFRMTESSTKVWPDLHVYVTGGLNGDRIHVQRRAGQLANVERTLTHMPSGFSALACHIGVAPRPDQLDFSVVRFDRATLASAVYTRSLCVSPAVLFDRENTRRGWLQLIAVISKNASVFTPTGQRDIAQIAEALSVEFAVPVERILISCTGIIGKPLPVAHIVQALGGLRAQLSADALPDVSRAILTTDRTTKGASLRIGDVVIGGYAKGAGMVEPNMATMLAYLYTNARVTKPELDVCLKRAVDRTFNSLSIDSDTSTSDTVVLTSSADQDLGPGGIEELELGLSAVCLQLARDIAREAEGATKLLQVTVKVPTSAADARFFAKKVVNSPLVKAAVFGSDPNWGRIVAAIGKPLPGATLTAIDPRDVYIDVQGHSVYAGATELRPDLNALRRAMQEASVVEIDVRIGTPSYQATVWGCDLSPDYVRENSEYST